LTFDHKVTSSIITVFKTEVSLDSHWELQFSNPEKSPKSEKNDPHYQTGCGPGLREGIGNVDMQCIHHWPSVHIPPSVARYPG